jgi:hypothetical protein
MQLMPACANAAWLVPLIEHIHNEFRVWSSEILQARRTGTDTTRTDDDPTIHQNN